MISAQVSLYPIESTEADQVINSCITALDQANLNYDVGPVSTFVSGDDNSVWQGLRDLFEMSQQHSGEVSMVITITNSQL